MQNFFSTAPFATQLSQELVSNNDIITTACITQRLICIGTVKGFVHIINIQSKEVTVLGPYSPIRQVSVLENLVAFITADLVVAYDTYSDSDVFSKSLPDPTQVAVSCETWGQTAVLCSVKEKVLLLQKGWVRLTERCIWQPGTVLALKVHFNLLCAVLQERVEFFSLSKSQVVYRVSLEGQVLIHWMSSSTVLVSENKKVSVIEYSQGSNSDNFTLKSCVELPSFPKSIASYNQRYILYEDGNELYLVSLEQEVIFQNTFSNIGMILSNNQNNAPFYIVSKNNILKVQPQTTDQKLQNLLNNKNFKQAYELAKRYQMPSEPILKDYIQHSIESKDFETATELVNELPSTSQYWTHLVEKFLEHNLVHLIASKIPESTSPSTLVSIVKQLIRNQRTSELIQFMQKWPYSIISYTDLIKDLKDNGFTKLLLEIYERTGNYKEALNLCLQENSEHTFTLLENHLSLLQTFIETQDLNQLFCINKTKTTQLLKDKAAYVPFETIAKKVKGKPALEFFCSLLEEKNTSELQNIIFELLLENNPESVPKFLKEASLLDLETSLLKAKQRGNSEAEFLVLQKLGMQDQCKEILEKDFEVRVKYIKDYPSFWDLTLAQGLDDLTKTQQVLCALKYHNSPSEFVASADLRGCDSQVKELIHSKGTHYKLSTNAASSFKVENFSLFHQLCDSMKKGLSLTGNEVCKVCSKALEGKIAYRYCKHHTHLECSKNCCECQKFWDTLSYR